MCRDETVEDGKTGGGTCGLSDGVGARGVSPEDPHNHVVLVRNLLGSDQVKFEN